MGINWKTILAVGVVLAVTAFLLGGRYTTIAVPPGAFVVDRLTDRFAFANRSIANTSRQTLRQHPNRRRARWLSFANTIRNTTI